MSITFEIEATESSPLCEVSVEAKSIMLSGVSMPENANEYYLPIIEKVTSLFTSASGDFVLTVDLRYMNSMSNKQLLRLMKHIESMGFSLTVNWQYQTGDDLMKVKGEELKRICSSINFLVNQA